MPSTAAPQEGLSKLAASTFLTAVVNIAVPVTMSLLTQPPAQSVSAALPPGPRPFLSRELSESTDACCALAGFLASADAADRARHAIHLATRQLMWLFGSMMMISMRMPFFVLGCCDRVRLVCVRLDARLVPLRTLVH